MNVSFEGKRALVTGGNKGIGFAIVQGLLAKGFDVILAARSLVKAKTAIEQLQSSNIRLLELDVSDDDSIDLAAKNLSREIDSLDILVNNAGIYPDRSVNILTVSRELLNQTMNVNAFGAVRVTQALLPLLMKSAAARVINTSSGYGQLSGLSARKLLLTALYQTASSGYGQLSGLSAEAPTYCLSKLALNGVTIMLAKALQTKGIVVNALDPGWVKTDMGSGVAPRTPEQGADTAIWLATEAPSNLSGKLFHEHREVSY